MEDDRGDGDDRPLGEDVRLSQRLAALYAVTARLTSSASVDEVLVEVARGVGQAIPRVGEVSIAVWDPRRGVIRDVLEFRTWTNRRVPLPPPGVHSVAGLPELAALLAGETRPRPVARRRPGGVGGPARVHAQVGMA